MPLLAISFDMTASFSAALKIFSATESLSQLGAAAGLASQAPLQEARPGAWDELRLLLSSVSAISVSLSSKRAASSATVDCSLLPGLLELRL